MESSAPLPEPSSRSVRTLKDCSRWTSTERILGFAAFGILLAIYFFHQAFPTVVGKSLAGWTWYACNSANNFLHGRFVPIAIGIMLWMAWQKNRDEEIKPSYWGLPILIIGLLFFIVAIRAIQPRVALIGAPFVIIGFAYYLFGLKIARYVIFPAFFLWFSIPVPGLEAALTGNLQVFITKACYQVGIFMGMDLTSSGSTISIAGSSLDIAEGCSGIRSLMALMMIAAVYAYYTQKPLWKKAFLFLCAFPLAIIGNFGRIFTILLLTWMGFEDFAKQTYHDWAGLVIFFPIALSGLYLIDYLLNIKTRRKKKVRRILTRSTVTTSQSTSNE